MFYPLPLPHTKATKIWASSLPALVIEGRRTFYKLSLNLEIKHKSKQEIYIYILLDFPSVLVRLQVFLQVS